MLSAQMLFDVLGDHAVQLHGYHDPQLSVENGLGTNPVETLASTNHNLTGWTQMQQQFGLTGKGQTVAVIDSGIAWDHVALGKGFGAGYRVVGGWDFTEENDANPYDDGPRGYHGTHVAGIIGSDDSTRTGVAPDVDLVALRVFNDAGQGNLSWVEKALQWVHSNRNSFENPITTVNLSLGSTWNSSAVPGWATLEEELRALHDDGIVVTASAGNSFKSTNAPGLSYPAASPYVLPVASIDDDGQLSDFSQRSERALAAPGRGILSTVPDHFLGRDGKINDFSTASGTSMAAPYVAGASVLVRQAMEMASWNNITADSIAEHLHSTADSVFDSVTNASYHRLDLQQAIDAIIPDDNIGGNSASAMSVDLSSNKLGGWINSLQDEDVYRFTANANGRLNFDANSDWLESLSWSLSNNGQTVESGGLTAKALSLTAGQTFELRVTAGDEIGPYQLEWNFQANTADGCCSSGGGSIAGGTVVPTTLGAVEYWQSTVNAGTSYRVQTTQDGLFSVQWHNAESQSGQLSLTPAGGASVADGTWDDGALRLDTEVKAGQWFDVRLPAGSGQGELSIANLLSQSGSHLYLKGTADSDVITINANAGLALAIGSIDYRFGAGQINNFEIDTGAGSDKVMLYGSSQADSVTLSAGLSKFQNSQLTIQVVGNEELTFRGNGGADSASLYDTNGNDSLSLRPHQAEMIGDGYKFNITDVDRIFIHATAGGQDVGYIYDSAGDDRLTVRPQFSSISGAGYYNYISGIERLYAYATAGGRDLAELYDSSGDDRFSTSGDAASIVGPSFSSYTKFFEKVDVHATAGGQDVAALYATNQATQWHRGSDFVSFSEDDWTREARGFEKVDTFIAGKLLSSAVSRSHTESSGHYFEPLSTLESESPFIVGSACPAIETDREYSSIGPTQVEQHAVNGEMSETRIGNNFDLQLEYQLMADVEELHSWFADRLDLPEEGLLADPNLERLLLDEIFEKHGEGRFL